MIVLKQLARTADVDPYKLRMALRRASLEPTNRRWQWPDAEDDHYKACLQVARNLHTKLASRNYGNASVSSGG